MGVEGVSTMIKFIGSIIVIWVIFHLLDALWVWIHKEDK